MSFHELTAGYPWLTKRAARVMDPQVQPPGRHPLAFLPALFVPYAGRMGAGFGMLMLVYIVGVLAAVAIPAYQDYTVKAQLTGAMLSSQGARRTIASYYEANQAIAASLAAAGVEAGAADGSQLELGAADMVLIVTTRRKQQLVFRPHKGAAGHIAWQCAAGDGIKPNQLPRDCR